MKKFTKFLVAVVLLASYSCVQDMTADLDQTIGSNQGEMVTLSATISAPEARTALGEKVGNVYPITWSEGDVVSVNGYAAGVEIVRGDSHVANLSVPASLETPYNLVYPWVEGVSASEQNGYSPVVFPSVQTHTEGTFAQGSAPMYGYASGFENVKLKHLVVALRFELKAKAGESVNLKYLTVSTVDGTPISGTFDVNCSNGDLVAREGNPSTILYDLGENGFALSDSSTSVFYVAVPQGSYEGFEVNYIAEGGAVMTKTFNAKGNKKLVAGKVREFEAIEFEATSSMYLISNDAELLDFAQQLAAGTVTAMGAMLVADIDMTDKAWTPVVLVDKVFDGNNKWIKGLSTPLFESVSSQVRNLNVESNLVVADAQVVGAICNKLEGGHIENCATVGTLTYSNQALVGASPSEIAVGGIVGSAINGNIVNCRNKMNIVITRGAASGLIEPSMMSVGGVIGLVDGDAVSVLQCKNHAEVKIAESAGDVTSSYFIGGIAGAAMSASEFKENYNYGSLVQATPVNMLYMGGVAGYAFAPISKCENHGSLSANAAALAYNLGGIAAQGVAMNGNTNYGAILTLNMPPVADAVSGTSVLRIGGVAAHATTTVEDAFAAGGDDSATFENNKNYGTIRSLASTFTGEIMCIAGVLGQANIPVSNCYNYHAPGTDKNAIDIYVGGTLAPSSVSGIAGVVGRTTADTNSISGVHNYGNIATHYTLSAQGQPFYHAGAIAYTLGAVSNSSNNGNLLLASDCSKIVGTNTLSMGGVIDYSQHGVLSNLRNTGEVKFAGQTSYIFKFGGVACYVDGSAAKTMTDCVNEGDLVFAGTSGNTVYVGGLVQDCDMSMTNCHNKGDILFTQAGAVGNTIQLAGLMDAISGSSGAIYDGCTVGGNISVACVVGGSIYVGGFFYNIEANCIVRNCELKGNIHITPTAITAGSGDYIGGFFATCKKTNVQLIGCKNSGEIKYEGMANKKQVNLAGISALHSAESTGATIKDCINEGDIIYKGVPGVVATYVYIGGILNRGQAQLTESSGNINRGRIIAEGHVANAYYVGGCVANYSSTAGSLTGFTNEGFVQVNGKSDDASYVGGVAAYVNLGLASGEVNDGTGDRIYDCHNKGEVRSEGKIHGNAYAGGVVAFSSLMCSPIFDATNSGNVYMGGTILGGDNAIGGIVARVGAAVVNCKNSGTVEVDPEARIEFQPVVGGIAGGVLRTQAITVECSGNENTGNVLGGKATAVGAITGVDRAVVVMPNSKVGGKVERNLKVVDLTEANYMDYIYGTKWSGEETEPAYDGATFVQVEVPEEGGSEGSDNTEETV